MCREISSHFGQLLWLGGSPCAGKSSVAALLAERYGLRLYACDDHFSAHLAAATATDQPTLQQLGGLSWDEIWQGPVSALVTRVIAIYREEFPLMLADLRALPGDRPVLVEGAGLLPELLAGLAIAPDHTYFLLPTASFQRTMYARRHWVSAILAQCSEPEGAFANWMARDEAYARWLGATASASGMPVCWVDGSQSLDATAAAVAASFQLEARAH